MTGNPEIAAILLPPDDIAAWFDLK